MEKQFDNEWKHYERGMEELAELKHMKELDQAQKESYQEGYNDAMDDVVRLIDYSLLKLIDNLYNSNVNDIIKEFRDKLIAGKLNSDTDV